MSDKENPEAPAKPKKEREARPKKGRSAAEEGPALEIQKERLAGPIPVPRFKELYAGTIRGELKKTLGLKNIHQVPRLQKIVINSGLGAGTKDFKVIEEMSRDIALITGQKPIIRRAVKDVSAFGVRAGNPIGLKVTLRNKRMYEFLDRLISITFPRVRDFRGISPRNFDRRGNLTIGVRDHTVFPEVDIDKVHHQNGMNITFVTTARTDEHAKLLLEAFGMPFAEMK